MKYRVKVVDVGDAVRAEWPPPFSAEGARRVDHEPGAADSWSVRVTFDPDQRRLDGATGVAEHLMGDAPALAIGEQFYLWVGHRQFATFLVDGDDAMKGGQTMPRRVLNVHIGQEFTDPGTGWRWRITDVGTRTFLAINLTVATTIHVRDGKQTERTGPPPPEDLRGPPYTVAEHVWDEYDQQALADVPELWKDV